MLPDSIIARVLDAGLANGADFAEVFIEDTYSSELSMADSKLSTALVGRLNGAGIRLFYGHEVIYTTTNDLSEAGLIRAAQLASQAKSGQARTQAKSLRASEFDSIHPYGARPWEFDRQKKFSFLQRMDQAARRCSSLVTQVRPRLLEKNQKVLIANSDGLLTRDERNYVRYFLEALVEENGSKESATERDGMLGTSEFFETIDFEKAADDAVERAIKLLRADYAPAGEMPVIIDNGFGGVIFHEACGHGLETTAVAKNASVFCGLLGEKIADSCVTAIDDGTIASKWGSLHIDDEGMPTKKTVLIENGVLKSYIVDQMGARQTGYQPTGSGRRQNYKFAPASRMRNTFIAPGKDSLESMIADLDYGLYAKEMGGGSVSPGTGDYNFGVREAYLVRNGKIEKTVKGATLIGRGIETLSKIVKVADNFSLATGMCGSVSGSIPTTVGQPAILVSKILVGGRA